MLYNGRYLQDFRLFQCSSQNLCSSGLFHGVAGFVTDVLGQSHLTHQDSKMKTLTLNMQSIPCPKISVRNQSMLNNLKRIHQQGTGTSTTETSTYLYYNKQRLWQTKSMPDSRYTIQNRPKCKNTSTREKAQDMWFTMCQKKLCFLYQLLS